jgi:hypothetical protein
MTAADAQAEAGMEDDKPSSAGRLAVQVYNEDAGGPPFTVYGGPGEKVSEVVAAVYAELKLEPKPTDRLTCVATGEDVRQYGEMHLREYAAGKCSELIWAFARDTGGAGA